MFSRGSGRHEWPSRRDGTYFEQWELECSVRALRGVLAACGEPEVDIKEIPVDRDVTQVVEKIVTVTAPPGPLTGTILADGSSTSGR